MRVWHLCSHEELEVFIVINIGISNFDLHDACITLGLLLTKNWIDGWINIFFNILNEARKSISNCHCDISQESERSKLKDLKIISFVHILDPLVGLLLWIDTKSISLSLHGEDTILTGYLITRKTSDTPVSQDNRVSHSVDKREVVTCWNFSFDTAFNPFFN